MAECRVVLVGMMGSGKSTIGHEVAVLTGWPLHDNDTLLAKLYSLTARDLLAQRGELALRAAELSALTLGLEQPPPCVVDAAAGTILDETARRALARELVVWLRAAPETLFARASGAAHRPWLDAGKDWFLTTTAQREPLYRSVARLVVGTDITGPSEIAREIVEWLRDAVPCASHLPSTA